MLNEHEISELFGAPIYRVTRADLLASGDLIDVSDIAREAGFAVPVALTAGVWADCVAWDEDDSQRQVYQDLAGRLWDVIWMASCAARRQRSATSTLFHLHRVPRGGRGRRARLVTLKLIISSGDAGEPVVTLLLPEED